MAETDTVTQARRAWGFLLSEANGQRSRENGTLAQAAGHVAAGTVLQLSGGKLIAFTADPLLSSGRPTTEAVGILGQDSDATGGDVAVAYLARSAEVNVNELVYPAETTAGGEKAATTSSLKLLGIIPR